MRELGTCRLGHRMRTQLAKQMLKESIMNGVAENARGPVKQKERLSWRELGAFGVGGIAYNLGTDALKQLAAPIYNIVLGLNPAWIGIVLMIGRLWDAVTDPLIGSISDNCRSRWGRRRPFVVIGAIGSAVVFPLIWLVPSHWGQMGMLCYLVATSLLFYTLFTVFSVPYFTLGMEISPDYDERTRATAARVFFSTFSGLLVTWTFRITQLDIFPDPLTGMRWVGVFTGVLMLASALPPGILIKERYQKLANKQPRVPLLQSARTTFANRPFVIVVAISVCMILGGTMFNALGIYVITYHVCAGDIRSSATLLGLSGTISTIAVLAGVPLVAWISGRWGKVRAAMICLGLGVIGSVLKWFLYTPEHPYWLLIVPAFMGPVLPGLWTIVHSMKADVCDLDELTTGLRREGIFASISLWIHKFAVALTFFISGLLLTAIGFDQGLGGNQSPQTILLLRTLFSIVPIGFFVICAALLCQYPLSRQEVERIREQLERRRSIV